MEPEVDSDSKEWDPRGFVSPSLTWLQYWLGSPDLIRIWMQTSRKFAEFGRMEELILKRVGQDKLLSVMAAIGLDAGREVESDVALQIPESEFARVGGYMHLLPPFQLKEDVELIASHVNQTPWATPNLGIASLLSDARKEEGVFYHVTYEKPTEVFVIPRKFDGLTLSHREAKRFSENLHLNRFCLDYLLSTGYSLYEGYTPSDEGKDPPDFIVFTGGESYGLECTQFTLSERRNAYGLFSSLQDAVVLSSRKNRNRFRNVRGCIVYAYFDSDDDTLVLPPRRTDSAFVGEIVDAIADIDMDFMELWVDRGEPKPSRMQIPHASTGSCGLYAVPMVGAFPMSQFSISTGFELGMGFSTFHRPDTELERLRGIIAAKDRSQQSKHLLITVGGPDERGSYLPSEDYILGLTLEEKLKPNSQLENYFVCENLEDVYLHFWNTGWIVQLVPEVKEIAPPRFPFGFVPGHLRLGYPEPSEDS